MFAKLTRWLGVLHLHRGWPPGLRRRRNAAGLGRRTEGHEEGKEPAEGAEIPLEWVSRIEDDIHYIDMSL